jgi:dihydroorotase-like cyclic amidohydrolase
MTDPPLPTSVSPEELTTLVIPVRDKTNRDQLWDALIDGSIDCVVSDHSPCTLELKALETGDIMTAWGGVSTDTDVDLAKSLPAMLGTKSSLDFFIY